MQFFRLRPFGAILLSATMFLMVPAAQAQSAAGSDLLGPGHWRVLWAPVSAHFRYSEEHRNAWALGVERQRPDNWLAGGAFFSNSFGQPCGYVYVGKRFGDLFDQPQLFAQASGGVIYGYRGKYATKLPLNVNGFAPGALVSVGWKLTPQSSVAAHLLGDAGVMLQLAYDLR
jgi:hypothetical protein